MKKFIILLITIFGFISCNENDVGITNTALTQTEQPDNRSACLECKNNLSVSIVFKHDGNNTQCTCLSYNQSYIEYETETGTVQSTFLPIGGGIGSGMYQATTGFTNICVDSPVKVFLQMFTNYCFVGCTSFDAVTSMTSDGIDIQVNSMCGQLVTGQVYFYLGKTGIADPFTNNCKLIINPNIDTELPPCVRGVCFTEICG